MICGQDSSTKTGQLSSEVTILHTTDHAGNLQWMHCIAVVMFNPWSCQNQIPLKCLVDDVSLSTTTVQHDIPKACDDNNDNDHNDDNTYGKNDDKNWWNVSTFQPA